MTISTIGNSFSNNSNPFSEGSILRSNLRILKRKNLQKSTLNNIKLPRHQRDYFGTLYLVRFVYRRKYSAVKYKENLAVGCLIADQLLLAHYINLVIIYKRFDSDHRIFLVPIYLVYIYQVYVQLFTRLIQGAIYILQHWTIFGLLLAILTILFLLEVFV